MPHTYSSPSGATRSALHALGAVSHGDPSHLVARGELARRPRPHVRPQVRALCLDRIVECVGPEGVFSLVVLQALLLPQELRL